MFWLGFLIGAMAMVALEAAILLWLVQRDRWHIARHH
jgi:hypothetical protein